MIGPIRRYRMRRVQREVDALRDAPNPPPEGSMALWYARSRRNVSIH